MLRFVLPASTCFLMRGTAGGYTDAVDVYNSATGEWSTARLSFARESLAATTVGNVAIFAGGHSGGELLWIEGGLLLRRLRARARMCVLHVCA